ncbi:MAG: twitching motility protein PilT [Desulfovibrio sp.]|nr:MAG: twitching motility protein PilT [Desulfovibrio sp.]
MDSRLASLVKSCVEKRATDLHITPFHPVVARMDGQVHPIKEVLFSGKEVDEIADSIMKDRHRLILKKRWSVDFSMFTMGANLRIHIASMARGLSISVRFLPGKIPTIENLNLHPSLKDLCGFDAGLIIFCGATGSGKSSTIASMLGEINRTRNAHVVTMEDPIEYRFQSIKSYFEQREMGLHFHSFEQALVDALRQMPDVILVGEMRQREIMQQTLHIAESGHLVFTTLHASSPEEAVYRICNSFPYEYQEMIRFQLASVLKAVIVQRLVYIKKLGFRVPLLSILRGNHAVKTSIRDNKLAQLEGLIDISKAEGMFTFERYQEEFLDRKAQFVKPSVAFKLDSSTKPDTVYESRHIDYSVSSDVCDEVPAVRSYAGGVGAANVMDITGSVGGQSVESGAVDEYIKQLEGGK